MGGAREREAREKCPIVDADFWPVMFANCEVQYSKASRAQNASKRASRAESEGGNARGGPERRPSAVDAQCASPIDHVHLLQP